MINCQGILNPRAGLYVCHLGAPNKEGKWENRSIFKMGNFVGKIQPTSSRSTSILTRQLIKNSYLSLCVIRWMHM
eukprot:1160962-Pelagomonas_calceolata.AAC.13